MRRARPDLPLLLLALATLVGVALRVPGFTDSLNGDELATYFVVTGHDAGRIVDIVQSDQEVTPPLYLLLAGWTQGIGDPQDALRLVPFACGILAVPLTWALGVRTLDRRAATVGAAIVALSPFLVFYATEARAYGLVLGLTLGATLALLRAVTGGEGRWWALYAVLSCAAMYTHYTAAFVLAGQAAWALVYHRGAWRPLIGANAAAGIAWLPWLSSYQADQDSPGAGLIGILRPFGWGTLKTDLLHWSISHPFTGFSVRDMPGEAALVLLALGLGVGLAGAVAGLRRAGRPHRLPGAGLALVLVLAVSTPLMAALYSAVSVSVFLPRNMICSSPGLALALGWVVTRPRSRRVWVPAAALLLAGFAVGGLRMLGAEAQRPDYKGAASFILERGGADAVIVDSPGFSPGALTQLDVPIARGEAEPVRPAVLRLARPTRAAQLEAGRPGGPGQFAVLPIPTPQEIAREAARRAGDREIYLVDPGTFTFAPVQLPGQLAATPVRQFLAALPDRFRPVTTVRFPGFFGEAPIFVRVLRSSAG